MNIQTRTTESKAPFLTRCGVWALIFLHILRGALTLSFFFPLSLDLSFFLSLFLPFALGSAGDPLVGWAASSVGGAVSAASGAKAIRPARLAVRRWARMAAGGVGTGSRAARNHISRSCPVGVRITRLLPQAT